MDMGGEGGTADFSHPWPDMLDLSPNHCINRVLVPIPVLPTSIDHRAVWALDHISTKKKPNSVLYV